MKIKKLILTATLIFISGAFFTSCMSSLTVRGQLPFFDYEVEFDNDSDYNNGRYDDGQYHEEYDDYEDRYDDGQYHDGYNNGYHGNNNNRNFEYVLAHRTWYSQGPFTVPYSDFYTSNHSFKINPKTNKILIQKDYYINNRYYDTLRIVYNYQISGNWDNKTQVRFSNPQIYDMSGRHIRENNLPRKIVEKDIYKYNPIGFDISFLPNAFVLQDQTNSGINYTFQ